MSTEKETGYWTVSSFPLLNLFNTVSKILFIFNHLCFQPNIPLNIKYKQYLLNDEESLDYWLVNTNSRYLMCYQGYYSITHIQPTYQRTKNTYHSLI